MLVALDEGGFVAAEVAACDTSWFADGKFEAALAEPVMSDILGLDLVDLFVYFVVLLS
jgi:hypothetical protein